MQYITNTKLNSNLSFGAMLPSSKAYNFIVKRAGNPEKLGLIEDIMFSMYNSKVNADIYVSSDFIPRLVASIDEYNGHGYQIKESLWDRLFHSPAKFLSDVKAEMKHIERKNAKSISK